LLAIIVVGGLIAEILHLTRLIMTTYFQQLKIRVYAQTFNDMEILGIIGMHKNINIYTCNYNTLANI